jgi:hypothetical protein
MQTALSALHEVIRAVVFGNGWLVLSGLGVVVLSTLAIRISRGIRI